MRPTRYTDSRTWLWGLVGRVRFSTVTRWYLHLPYGRKVMLHRFAESDRDRDLHDHPYDFVSLVLRGGYVEKHRTWVKGRRYRDEERRVIVRWNRRRAEDLHRVLLLRWPTWTLVLTGRRRRQWGFLTRRGWVAEYDYERRGG